mmetsp:Transcript_8999/g.13049  ORF Transcript_8999/g.13049 Transcript_8999/m.13049 type:complete len:357 (-) Transcript_8999:293-1363(-)
MMILSISGSASSRILVVAWSLWLYLLFDIHGASSFATPTSSAFTRKSSSKNMMSDNNVAVFGCGVLGSSLCRQIVQSPPDGIESITAITKSTKRHESIRTDVLSNGSERIPFSVTTAEEALSDGTAKKYKHVVFCGPPSGFEDYASAVKQCMEKLWLGPSDGGMFVFTSSGGVYEGKEGETVTENCPTLDPETNPRTARIINAERVCLQNKGCVLRLAGLYTISRGAHNYWLTSGKDVQGRPDGIVNLLHYDDAAGACLSALSSSSSSADQLYSQVFLISDGNPTTRYGICESAKKHVNYKEYDMPSFTSEGEGSLGKVYDGSWSNDVLHWTPRYESFDQFMITENDDASSSSSSS